MDLPLNVKTSESAPARGRGPCVAGMTCMRDNVARAVVSLYGVDGFSGVGRMIYGFGFDLVLGLSVECGSCLL